MIEQQRDPADEQRRWQVELDLAKKTDKDFVTRGKKIVKRYRDERGGTDSSAKRYNVLWSNVRTLLPAVYTKKPKAEVARRYKDADPVARAAAEILERSLQYEIDQYSDYDSAIRGALLDRLLPGRGVAWVRFQPVEVPDEIEPSGPETEEAGELQVTDDTEYYAQYETSPVDYVFWEDFRHSPARTWEEVNWVARRVYMSKDEVVERFGEEFADVPLSHEPIGLDDAKKEGYPAPEVDRMKKAVIWEIWCKCDKTAYWYCEGYNKILDMRDDPLKLDCFFPCPKPLFATLTTDTLIPVPDYAQYQDQAKEIDELTNRIWLLVKAVKVVGVYDASQTGVQRMLSEGVDNVLIPVDTWAAFSEKGGIKGVVDFLPIEMVLKTLQGLYEAREAAKQVIYEVTGLSDIIRGASVASETATAQQIKSQFASLRLREAQYDVSKFATELLQIKAQIMCSLYRPETLVSMSGVEGTMDATLVPQALELLRSEPLRNFRIQVAADSLVEIDEQTEKQSRLEMLTAVGSFLEKATMMVQAAPETAQLAGELLMFGVRSFKSANTIEQAFDQTIQAMSQPKPPQPDPEQQKAEMQAQADQAKMQATLQAEQIKAQAQVQMEQIRLQAQFEMKQQEAQFSAQLAQQVEAVRQQAESEREALRLQFEAWKAQLIESTKVNVAQISAQATLTAQQDAIADASTDD